MIKKNDPRLIIFMSAAFILIVGGIILGVATSSKGENDNSSGVAKLSVDSTYYDFGDVSMAKGLVNHTFKITNEGEGELKISNISTSCMCTTAVLDVAGEKSPSFGMPGHGGANPTFWSATIKPNQTADLIVTFDPNAHGPQATGPITRVITIYSNDNSQSNVRRNFTFAANVVK